MRQNDIADGADAGCRKVQPLAYPPEAANSEKPSSSKPISRSKFLTVFTPTYNRAHTLPRVYESLCRQTFKDFEWLIVDDGSTDDTWRLFVTTTPFPVRYYWQPHSGKHVAHNLALTKARGFLFAPLDSDDELTPTALEAIHSEWLWTDSDYAGIGGLCRDEHGQLIGQEFPRNPFDRSHAEMVFIDRIRGEKWVALRADILRQYLFPEIGGQFVPEGLVWLRMSKYKIRWINEVLRIYHKSQDSLTANKRKSWKGILFYYAWLLLRHPQYFMQSAWRRCGL